MCTGVAINNYYKLLIITNRCHLAERTGYLGPLRIQPMKQKKTIDIKTNFKIHTIQKFWNMTKRKQVINVFIFFGYNFKKGCSF